MNISRILVLCSSIFGSFYVTVTMICESGLCAPELIRYGDIKLI